jgi:hypothetical protein
MLHLQRKQAVIKQRNINGQVVYDLENFNEEEDLPRICNVLSDLYSMNILTKIQGPGTAMWEIELEEHRFSLVNSTWGCFLKPESKAGVDFIEIQRETLNRLL